MGKTTINTNRRESIRTTRRSVTTRSPGRGKATVKTKANQIHNYCSRHSHLGMLESLSKPKKNFHRPRSFFYAVFLDNIFDVWPFQMFERIWPTNSTHRYFKYFESLSYSEKLMDSYEYVYGNNRRGGQAVLSYCCQS